MHPDAFDVIPHDVRLFHPSILFGYVLDIVGYSIWSVFGRGGVQRALGRLANYH
jgi:hypothetical protein